VFIALEPRRQSRFSIFFRFLLVIPFSIFAYFFGVVTAFVEIAAWFTALVLGEVPEGMHSFMSLYVQYMLELYSYGNLLTRRFPWMNQPASRGLRPTFESDRVELNRLAVFFRLILVLPAYVVSSLLTFGTSIYIFAMWIVGTIAGREPASLHQAAALSVRFQVRTMAYLMLLSPTQPFTTMFGEAVAAPTAVVDEDEDEDEVEAEEVAGDETGELSGDPFAPWSVVSGARTLAQVALALGAAVIVALSLVAAMFVSNHQNDLNRVEQEKAVRVLNAVSYLQYNQGFLVSIGSCNELAQCLRGVANQSAQAQESYIATFEKTSFPSSVQSEYSAFRGDIQTIADAYASASISETADQYRAAIEQITPALNAASQDGAALIKAL
jgi:hypothetical protein